MNEEWIPNAQEWAGEDAFLIGGGASLLHFDFSCLRSRNVIGCNDAFHLGPEIIRYNVFGDASWYARNRFKIVEAKGITFVSNAAGMIGCAAENIRVCKRIVAGFAIGGALAWNNSTGAMAINLAVNLGAVRIFLLGYDLSNSPERRSHWHNYNPKTTIQDSFDRFQLGFQNLSKALPSHAQVFNVTDGSSRLECFRKISFDSFAEILKGVQQPSPV